MLWLAAVAVAGCGMIVAVMRSTLVRAILIGLNQCAEASAHRN
jgi:hypothetical protein